MSNGEVTIWESKLRLVPITWPFQTRRI